MSEKTEEIMIQTVEAIMMLWPEDAIRLAFDAGFRIGVGFRKWPRGLSNDDLAKARRAILKAWRHRRRFAPEDEEAWLKAQKEQVNEEA